VVAGVLPAKHWQEQVATQIPKYRSRHVRLTFDWVHSRAASQTGL